MGRGGVLRPLGFDFFTAAFAASSSWPTRSRNWAAFSLIPSMAYRSVVRCTDCTLSSAARRSLARIIHSRWEETASDRIETLQQLILPQPLLADGERDRLRGTEALLDPGATQFSPYSETAG
jgi:hypothetical protein